MTGHPLHIFIGYDSREVSAFHVLADSLMRHSSRQLAIHPLYRPALVASGLYTRARGPHESTEFSLTRFLVPYLSYYAGISLFLDCDILCQGDVAQVFAFAEHDPFKSCFVVKHDYTPRTQQKMDGQVQTAYAKKNWSSVLLFQNSLCHALTVDYVNRASGLALHQFAWTRDEHVGSLPMEWNWLVGEYPENPDAAMLHYTLGGPWFTQYQHGEESERWLKEYRRLWLTSTS